MIGFLRLGIFLLIAMSVVYLLLRIYLRSLARERLEKRYDAKPHPGSRDDFVAAGLRDYEKSMGRKLLWGVFVLPVVVIGTLVYVLNFT